MGLSNWATIISAVSALVAFGFSIFVFFRTQKLILPTERPIIELDENKCSGNLSADQKLLQIDMLSIFQNIGKHPASEIRIQIGMCSVTASHEFRNYVDGSAANVIRPGTKFNWNQRVGVPVQVDDREIMIPDLELIIYVRIAYNDEWAPKRKKFVDDFYLAYSIGNSAAAHATAVQREMIEGHVKQIYH